MKNMFLHVTNNFSDHLKKKYPKESHQSSVVLDRELDGLNRLGSGTNLSGFKRGASVRGDMFRSPLLNKDLKRAESMRFDAGLKKPRRTPSFTTRRRTHSFKKHKAPPPEEALPHMEIEGELDRKSNLISGGKRATQRSWKSYYTGELV